MQPKPTLFVRLVRFLAFHTAQEQGIPPGTNQYEENAYFTYIATLAVGNLAVYSLLAGGLGILPSALILLGCYAAVCACAHGAHINSVLGCAAYSIATLLACTLVATRIVLPLWLLVGILSACLLAFWLYAPNVSQYSYLQKDKAAKHRKLTLSITAVLALAALALYLYGYILYAHLVAAALFAAATRQLPVMFRLLERSAPTQSEAVTYYQEPALKLSKRTCRHAFKAASFVIAIVVIVVAEPCFEPFWHHVPPRPESLKK